MQASSLSATQARGTCFDPFDQSPMDQFESPCCNKIATFALNLFHAIAAAATAGAILHFALKTTVFVYSAGALAAGLVTFAILSYLSSDTDSRPIIVNQQNRPSRQKQLRPLEISLLKLSTTMQQQSFDQKRVSADKSAADKTSAQMTSLSAPNSASASPSTAGTFASPAASSSSVTVTVTVDQQAVVSSTEPRPAAPASAPTAPATAQNSEPIGGEEILISSRRQSLSDEPATANASNLIPGIAIATTASTAEPSTPGKLPTGEAIIAAAPAAPSVKSGTSYWTYVGYGTIWGNPPKDS